MRLLSWILAAAALVAAPLAAPAQVVEPSKDKPLKLAFVTNSSADFWSIARAGVNKAVADLGDVEVDFRIPSDGSAATQKRIVEDLLAKGVQGIAISPKDPANQVTLLNKAAQRALVICHDSDAPESNRAFYIGTDNKAAGRQAGELLKECLPQGGKIMVFVGSMDAQNAKDRLAGIKEVVAGSGIEIIDVRTDEGDRVRAKTNVKDTLTKYPGISGLVGLWSYNGPAMINAVKEAGKAGKLQVVCFDEEEETLAGVRDGVVYATVVQQPFEFGYQSIVLMRKHKLGDTSFIPAQKMINVPTLAIKKADVEAFTRKIHTILGK